VQNFCVSVLMASAVGSYAAKATLGRGAERARGVLSGAGHAARGNQIDWIDLNWPCRREPFCVLHYDHAELKEKVRAVCACERVLMK
jgi:hypothetical protein